MRYIEAFNQQDVALRLMNLILTAQSAFNKRLITIMEVCGTHTMAIARMGIRQAMGSSIKLISGPGCPVCVTPPGYIDAAISLASQGAIIVSFGDMINVPGSEINLAIAKSRGYAIETCYSPTTAIDIANCNPGKEIVFLGIGFETTIAAVLGMLDRAQKQGIKNLSILSSFKRVPPVLDVLASDPQLKIDGFILPAHVSTIIGKVPYMRLSETYKKACVIAGFEPLDILYGIYGILCQLASETFVVDNQYSRVVRKEGNTKILQMFDYYLQICESNWRGIGRLPFSGFKLKDKWAMFDTEKKFNIKMEEGICNKGCKCGEILKGILTPFDCPLFAKTCYPSNPVGPCMVSAEGTCAAYYKYEYKGKH